MLYRTVKYSLVYQLNISIKIHWFVLVSSSVTCSHFMKCWKWYKRAATCDLFVIMMLFFGGCIEGYVCVLDVTIENDETVGLLRNSFYWLYLTRERPGPPLPYKIKTHSTVNKQKFSHMHKSIFETLDAKIIHQYYWQHPKHKHIIRYLPKSDVIIT